MNAQLCKCNNCEEVFIDENPDKQPLFDTTDLPILRSLEALREDGDFIWGCPNCKTDGYLVDIVDGRMLAESLSTMAKNKFGR